MPTRTPPPARVLVVDDNELSREMLSRRLRNRGYEVAVARNGLEALDVLRIEKGFPTHREMDGRTTAFDLGLRVSEGSIGAAAASRPGLKGPERHQLVGLSSNLQIHHGRSVQCVRCELTLNRHHGQKRGSEAGLDSIFDRLEGIQLHLNAQTLHIQT